MKGSSLLTKLHESPNSVSTRSCFWALGIILSSLFRLTAACCNIVMQIQCIPHNESLLSMPIHCHLNVIQLLRCAENMTI